MSMIDTEENSRYDNIRHLLHEAKVMEENIIGILNQYHDNGQSDLTPTEKDILNMARNRLVRISQYAAAAITDIE